MAVYNKNNKFISYLLLLISIFIIILFTKNSVVSLQTNLDLKESYNNELSDKKIILQELNDIKKKLNSDSKELNKYNIKIKENEIIDYIYGYIEKINSESGVTIVKSISISNPIKTEIGFNQSSINLNLRVSDYKSLERILNFLISDKNKYKFFIEAFTYPYSEDLSNFNVSIPLKILYK